MGQRRSPVVQLLVYNLQLVSKLSIRDWLIYDQQLIANCHALIYMLLHCPTTLSKTLELNPQFCSLSSY